MFLLGLEASKKTHSGKHAMWWLNFVCICRGDTIGDKTLPLIPCCPLPLAIGGQEAYFHVPLVFNEIEFSLLVRAPETNGLLGACKELGVTVLAWAPLASGRLTQKESMSNISDTATLALREELKQVVKVRSIRFKVLGSCRDTHSRFFGG